MEGKMTDEERLTPFPALAEPAKMPPLKRYRVTYATATGFRQHTEESAVPIWQYVQTVHERGIWLTPTHCVARSAIVDIAQVQDDEGVDQ
jgi:hypothetical protein